MARVFLNTLTDGKGGKNESVLQGCDDLFTGFTAFLDRVLKDEKIGTKMSKAGIIIKFIYTDPDAEITIDLKNPPAKPGYYGTFIWGHVISRRTSGPSSRLITPTGFGMVWKILLPESPRVLSSRVER